MDCKCIGLYALFLCPVIVFRGGDMGMVGMNIFSAFTAIFGGINLVHLQ